VSYLLGLVPLAALAFAWWIFGKAYDHTMNWKDEE